MSDFSSSDGEAFDFDSDVDVADLIEINDGLAEEVENLSVRDFKITSLEEVQRSLDSMVARAASMFGLSFGVAQILLGNSEWNLGEMSSNFVENPDKEVKKLGVKSASDLALLQPISKNDRVGSKVSKGQRKPKRSEALMDCPICCSATATISLGCKHRVCKDCLRKHIQIQAIENRKISTTTCPGDHDCPLLITRDVILSLDAPKLLAQFDKLVAQLHVERQPHTYQFCPHPGCGRIAEKPMASSPGHQWQADGYKLKDKASLVHCHCGHDFCFNCGLPINHYAVPCETASQWLAAVDHEHRSSRWIMENTKQCPKCHTKIQRSEGCNHMVCGNCGHEFCWVCSQNWSDHSGKSYYNCVKFAPYETLKSQSAPNATTPSKRQKERINHYILRYDNHNSLSMLVDDNVAREAHNLLAWSYVLLCCAIFNNNRILLEELVTELGRDIEENPSRLRQRTSALTDFVMTTDWTMDRNMVLSITHVSKEL